MMWNMLKLNEVNLGLRSDSRRITIFVVYLSLLLDNVLLTMIVPIMPDFLINSIRKNEGKSLNNQEYHTSYQVYGLEYIAEGNESIKMPVMQPSLTEMFDANSENGRVSLLLSSKALVQLILNPMVGSITSRVGYPFLLFLGTCILFISAIVFAFGTGYLALFLARSFQGVASSCIGITGMCLVAEKYPNEPSRSKMMGFVLGSVAVGVLIGYPFGGFMYDFWGKTAPFLVTALFVFIDGALQFCYSDLKPTEEKSFPAVGWIQLFSDKRILLTGGAIGISTSTIAILEPCLPIWLLQEIKPKKWQLGTAFIPDSLGYFIGTNSVALIAYQCRRPTIAVVAMALVGISASLVPAASTMLQLVVPHFLLGFGIGAVDAALVPLLAALVDTRYSTHYGTVYAMQQISVSLAYFLGPVLGSCLAKAVGFPWMMRIVGFVNIMYCPLLLSSGVLEEDLLKGMEPQRRGHRTRSGYEEFSDSNSSD
ncbi:hypothetical protein RUM43_013249 [Polyplax serrata]|uniref:Major facilitator superfamily (MFS) profile domain-containing protein n=1 Tax=Polyplax serrata TaxID=468196 RepID=A0AAN8RZ83_POLSC